MRQAQSGRSAGGDRSVPAAVIARLPELLRVLNECALQGEHTVSSESLASRLEASGALVRKDLSFLGFSGTRGVGYDVAALRMQIADALGLTARRPVALIGMGHLGRALVAYPGFVDQGFGVAAAFDSDPRLVGLQVAPGVVVRDIADLEPVIESLGITMAILAVPAAAAQAVAGRLVDAGVVGLLNFAPVALAVPGHVRVRRVDLAADLHILAFHATPPAHPDRVPA